MVVGHSPSRVTPPSGAMRTYSTRRRRSGSTRAVLAPTITLPSVRQPRIVAPGSVVTRFSWPVGDITVARRVPGSDTRISPVPEIHSEPMPRNSPGPPPARPNVHRHSPVAPKENTRVRSETTMPPSASSAARMIADPVSNSRCGSSLRPLMRSSSRPNRMLKGRSEVAGLATVGTSLPLWPATMEADATVQSVNRRGGSRTRRFTGACRRGSRVPHHRP